MIDRTEIIDEMRTETVGYERHANGILQDQPYMLENNMDFESGTAMDDTLLCTVVCKG